MFYSFIALSFSVVPANAIEQVSNDFSIGGLYDIENPAVLNVNKKPYVWFSGVPSKNQYSREYIFFTSKNDKGQFTEPQISFSKPGYLVSDPAIVKHPVRNQVFMFYTQQEKTGKMVPRRLKNGKKVVSYKAPMENIGVAYAVACKDSIDGSGLCWTDLSAKRPLIGNNNGFSKFGGGSPAVFLDGARLHIYYKSNPPGGALLRSAVEYRDWETDRKSDG